MWSSHGGWLVGGGEQTFSKCSRARIEQKQINAFSKAKRCRRRRTSENSSEIKQPSKAKVATTVPPTTTAAPPPPSTPTTAQTTSTIAVIKGNVMKIMISFYDNTCAFHFVRVPFYYFYYLLYLVSLSGEYIYYKKRLSYGVVQRRVVLDSYIIDYFAI